MQNNHDKGPLQDYYKATIEKDELVLKPYCSCGRLLDEDYFCEKCNRRCNCNQIRCDSETTLGLVNRYIKESSKFSGFKAILANKT